MDGVDDSTSTPGTLAIADNSTSTSANDAPPQLPIITVEANLHLKDFRPS